ncbi:MAG: InlB B-repeat-containing protein [Candidatus Izemoplasmataceae bacterium]
MKKLALTLLFIFTLTLLSACEAETYTVTFVDYNALEISSQTVSEGDDANLPSEPNRIGYNFIGWDKTHTNIKEDTIIQAQYEENETLTSFNALLTSVHEATRIEALTQVIDNEQLTQEVYYSREERKVYSKKTGEEEVTIYINEEDGVLFGYDYNKDTDCYTKVNISQYQFDYIFVDHTNSHMLPDRIELSWFDIDGDTYTLNPEYKENLKARIGATGNFVSYVITITETGLELDIELIFGAATRTIHIEYTNIGTQTQSIPEDLYTCS